MFKYTINPNYQHYFKKKVGNYWNYYSGLPLDLFISDGWPNTYEAKNVIHYLPGTIIYSKEPLKEVPVRGILVPVKFFEVDENPN